MMSEQHSTILAIAIAALLSGGAQASSANNNAASPISPMSPDEIRTLRHQFDEVEKAKQRPAPKADVRRRTIHTIDLTAGPTEEMATVAIGYATTVIAVGENGKPWPIQTVIPGNSAALEATLLTKKAATSAVLHAKHPWVSSNVINLSLTVFFDTASGIRGLGLFSCLSGTCVLGAQLLPHRPYAAITAMRGPVAKFPRKA